MRVTTMFEQCLEIPFGEFEGTGALKLPSEAQNCDKMQIVTAKSCECQKFSVPLRSQRKCDLICSDVKGVQRMKNEMVHICKATQSNWDRLSTSCDERLSKRANKTRSTKKVVAVTYANSANAFALLNAVTSIEAPIEDVMLTLCVRVLQIKNLWGLPHVLRAMIGYLRQYHLLEFDVSRFDWNTKEDLLGFVLQSLQSEGDRNDTGQYYTHADVVRHMIGDLCLSKDETFFDPCCGSGAFLLGVKTQYPESLYGSDINPLAVMVAKVNLLIKYSNHTFIPHVYCIDFLHNSSLLNYEEEGYRVLFSRKYTYIYTNPPWGADKKGLYCVPGIGSKERSSMFLVKSMSMLEPRGHTCFLMPTSLLNIAAHSDVRNFILTKNTIEHIDLYNDRFDGVYTDYFSIKIRPVISKIQQYSVGNLKPIILPVDSPTQSEIPIKIKNVVEESILRKMDQKGEDYLTHSKWALGIVTGDNKRKLLPEATALSEEIYTGKEISSYRLKPAKKHIIYAPDTFQQCAREELYRAPEKLIYRFIAKYPIVAFDNKQKLCLNSANILIPEISGMSVRCVGALLNSALYRFYYMQKFSDLKVLKSNLQKMPFPSLSVSQREQLKQAVFHLYEHVEDKKNILDIDALVFSIFGLSESESQYVYDFIKA